MPSSSRVLTPPMGRVTDNDPQIVRVDQKEVEWGARRSQQPSIKNDMTVKNLSNGQ